MAGIAILIDGSDQPIRGGRVDFPTQAVATPRRPLAGLAIALVTAVVTMAATGQDAPTSGDPATTVAACPGATVLSPGLSPVAPGRSAPTGQSAVSWWRLPVQHRYVDPATGMTVQIEAPAPSRSVDHRDRVR